jgi:hypothetical protein
MMQTGRSACSACPAAALARTSATSSRWVRTHVPTRTGRGARRRKARLLRWRVPTAAYSLIKCPNMGGGPEWEPLVHPWQRVVAPAQNLRRCSLVKQHRCWSVGHTQRQGSRPFLSQSSVMSTATRTNNGIADRHHPGRPSESSACCRFPLLTRSSFHRHTPEVP